MRFGRGGGGGKSLDINLIPTAPDDGPWVRHNEVRLEGRGWFLAGEKPRSRCVARVTCRVGDNIDERVSIYSDIKGESYCVEAEVVIRIRGNC